MPTGSTGCEINHILDDYRCELEYAQQYIQYVRHAGRR